MLVAAARRSTLERIIRCPTYPVPIKTPGLSVAVRQFQDAFHEKDVHLPTLLARLYASARFIEDRKRKGQFFTSREVAAWALLRAEPSSRDDVCDAGAGTAVFADAILRRGISVRSYTGVENDAILALCAAHVLEGLNAPHSFRVWYANFLRLSAEAFLTQGLRTPTLVISNPPFVRYHHLSGRARMRTALKSSLGITLSSFSGSMGYFLTRAAELAGFNGDASGPKTNNSRLLFFLPQEAKGAAYVQQLRDDLWRMHGWVCREHKIPSIQTDIDGHRSNTLALFFVFEQKKMHRTSLPSQSKTIARVRDLLKVKRGISTGCNDFFVLTDKEVLDRKIDKERWLKKVLPTRIHVPDRSFSKEDWESLCESGHACWLLALPAGKLEDFDAPVRKYLREGLQRGLHTTSTAKALRTWFSLPIPKNPPDLFVTYFFRGLPRFILNEAQVFNLTNILGGRFISAVHDPKRKGLIIDSLNVQARVWIKANAGREYKGGLRKIEPRELSMLSVDPATVQLVTGESRAAIASTGLLFE
ncbi:MAG TPA: hypothetical protein VKC61_21600 [Pyrinomonadaceae bacterium]|nr:hypothetical protein [Pyrinomonadaceae bacterium]